MSAKALPPYDRSMCSLCSRCSFSAVSMRLYAACLPAVLGAVPKKTTGKSQHEPPNAVNYFVAFDARHSGWIPLHLVHLFAAHSVLLAAGSNPWLLLKLDTDDTAKLPALPLVSGLRPCCCARRRVLAACLTCAAGIVVISTESTHGSRSRASPALELGSVLVADTTSAPLCIHTHRAYIVIHACTEGPRLRTNGAYFGGPHLHPYFRSTAVGRPITHHRNAA